MLCDCKGPIEGRSYTHPSLNLRASFMWWRGWPDNLQGHWGHPPFFNATPCQPVVTGAAGGCSPDPDWSLPLPDALQEVGGTMLYDT